jgi:hypothetical protein
MGLDLSLSQILPVHDDPKQNAAAVRAVLWRVERGLMDQVQARRVLEALGLVKPNQPLLASQSASGARSGVLPPSDPTSPSTAQSDGKNGPSRDRSRT